MTIANLTSDHALSDDYNEPNLRSLSDDYNEPNLRSLSDDYNEPNLRSLSDDYNEPNLRSLPDDYNEPYLSIRTLFLLHVQSDMLINLLVHKKHLAGNYCVVIN